jgi:hypothetical protein
MLSREIDLRRGWRRWPRCGRAPPAGCSGTTCSRGGADGIQQDPLVGAVRTGRDSSSSTTSCSRAASDDRPGPRSVHQRNSRVAEPVPVVHVAARPARRRAEHVARNLVAVAKALFDHVHTFATEGVGSGSARCRRPATRTTATTTASPRTATRCRCSTCSCATVTRSATSGAPSCCTPTEPGRTRHVGTIEPLWNIFDLTPEGRQPDWDEQLEYDQ